MFNKLLIFTNIYQYETSYTFIQLLPVPTHDCRIHAYLFYTTFFVSFVYCIYFYLVSSTLRFLFLKKQWTLELEYSILLLVLSHITHTTISAWSVTSRWTFDCWLNSSFTFPFFPQDLCLGKPIAKLIYSLSWCWWKDPNYAWEPSSQPQPQLQLNSSQLPLLILWRHF